MKHTPTPWFVDDSGNALAIVQKDDPTQWIATLYQSSAGQATNAEFIVCAVNAHDDLLRALKLAADTFHIIARSGDACTQLAASAEQNARTAIRKAESHKD